LVGSISDVIGSCARTIDQNLILKTALSHQMKQDSFGGWGATDISKANEADTDHAVLMLDRFRDSFVAFLENFVENG